VKPTRNTIVIFIGFWSAVAIIAGIAILTYRNILNVLDSFEEVRRTNQVIENLEEIVSTVKDAEIGQRDYIITGDEGRLGPYYASVNGIDPLMATLRSLTASNLKQQRRISLLDPLIAHKLASMRERIELRKIKGFDAARQDIRAEQEESLMDQIHIVVGEMENEEVHLLATHEAKLRLREQITFSIFALGTFVSLGLVLGIFLLLNKEITWRGKAEQALKREHDSLELRVQERTVQLADANKGLRKLSGTLLDLQDQERRQIARNLHDTTGQNLSAVTLNLARLRELYPAADERLRSILAETLTLAEQCLREIRTLSYVLHPPLLDETGLASALRWYVKGFTGRSGIPVDLVVPPDQERLPSEIETTLFRVIQEGLTNIHRHSGCKRASIELVRLPHEVRLEIKDNGKGFPKDPTSHGSNSTVTMGVGLMGMRERLRQLNGQMEIVSSPRGTTVKATLPLGKNGL
jgi:signal transduction histidine kinase